MRPIPFASPAPPTQRYLGWHRVRGEVVSRQLVTHHPFTPSHISNQPIKWHEKNIISHSASATFKRINKLGWAQNSIHFSLHRLLPHFSNLKLKRHKFVTLYAPRANGKLLGNCLSCCCRRYRCVVVVVFVIAASQLSESNFDDERHTAQRWNKRGIFLLSVKNMARQQSDTHTHTPTVIQSYKAFLHIRATNQTFPFRILTWSFIFRVFSFFHL